MTQPWTYTIFCTETGFRGKAAKYKIAAEWSGGGYTELKTFSFADDDCLEDAYRAARRRAAEILLLNDEQLGPMAIYQLERGKHDYELRRRQDLEERFNERSTPPPADRPADDGPRPTP
ncbi:MAG: hypothetical protein ACRDD1_01795 [Planctomycetia bacterium]